MDPGRAEEGRGAAAPPSRKIRPLLLLGAAAHLAGMAVYDAFPFLYLASVPLLALAFHLRLAETGIRPLSTPAFWGMVVVLAVPVVGLLAAAQRIAIASRTGDGRADWRDTLVTFLAAVPAAVLLAALLLPGLPAEGRVPMGPVLAFGAAAEGALFAAYAILGRTRRKEPGS